MRPGLALLVGFFALVLHERYVRRPDGRHRVLARAALLAVALLSAAASGPDVREYVSTWFRGSTAPLPASFDSDGDALGSKALAAQRPLHPFPSGGGANAVTAWQEGTRLALREHQDLKFVTEEIGAVPTTVLSSEVVGHIRRTLVHFTADDGTRVPAYVLDPGGPAKKAGVLVIPGHGEGIRATAGLVEEYQHQAALALARRGYVVLTPELRGFGMLAPGARSAHRFVAATALAAGTSYKALVAKDLHRALTVLEHWQGVDPDRLAAVGTSLGGELAVLLAGIDSRIKVTVSNGYGGATGPVVENEGADDALDEPPHGCHTMPGINKILMGEDWARLVAPRPLLIVRGSHEPASRSIQYRDLAREAYPSAVADRFGFDVGEGGHEFFENITARFLMRWL